MTLKEMKVKTFSLIEEYYPDVPNLAEDEDVINKINGVVNQIQLDLMKYRNINAYEDFTISKDSEKVIDLKSELSDLYQLIKIDIDGNIEYDMPNEDLIVLPNDYEGTFRVYYYKYPKLVKVMFEGSTEEEKQQARDTEDQSYKFELDNVLLEIMPYGIAADLLKMDMISNYGTYFYNRYLEMKNSIDSRRTSGIARITGGTNV